MCICIVFILQYQKVKNNYQIVLKRAETNVVPIIFNGVLFHVRALLLPLALHESGTRRWFFCNFVY